MIFWGPPGSGKTTLAYILAKETKRPFYSISAINAGVKDVREVIARASEGDDLFSGGGQPILFIDEIHRFSKSQQDSLLSAVERGQITLVGATTETPVLKSYQHCFRAVRCMCSNRIPRTTL